MKKRLIWIVVAVLIVLVVLAVALPLIFIDPLVKKGVETVGPKVAKVAMKLEGAHISLFSGKGTLRGLFVGNPEGYKEPSAFTAGEITVAVQPSSLFSDKLIVRTVRIINPDITFEGGPKNNNFTKILENVQAFSGSGGTNDAKASSGGPSKKLQVDELTITGAKVNATTELSGGQPVTLTLPDIHLTALGTGPEGITASDLAAVLLKEVSGQTVAAMGQAISKLGAEAVNSAGKAANEAVGKTADKAVGEVTKGIGGLFKKK